MRAYECDALEPFELCLDIEGDDGAKRYYSRYDWMIEPDATRAELAGGPRLRIDIPSAETLPE